MPPLWKLSLFLFLWHSSLADRRRFDEAYNLIDNAVSESQNNDDSQQIDDPDFDEKLNIHLDKLLELTSKTEPSDPTQFTASEMEDIINESIELGKMLNSLDKNCSLETYGKLLNLRNQLNTAVSKETSNMDTFKHHLSPEEYYNITYNALKAFNKKIRGPLSDTTWNIFEFDGSKDNKTDLDHACAKFAEPYSNIAYDIRNVSETFLNATNYSEDAWMVVLRLTKAVANQFTYNFFRCDLLFRWLLQTSKEEFMKTMFKAEKNTKKLYQLKMKFDWNSEMLNSIVTDILSNVSISEKYEAINEKMNFKFGKFGNVSYTYFLNGSDIWDIGASDKNFTQNYWEGFYPEQKTFVGVFRQYENDTKNMTCIYEDIFGGDICTYVMFYKPETLREALRERMKKRCSFTHEKIIFSDKREKLEAKAEEPVKYFQYDTNCFMSFRYWRITIFIKQNKVQNNKKC